MKPSRSKLAYNLTPPFKKKPPTFLFSNLFVNSKVFSIGRKPTSKRELIFSLNTNSELISGDAFSKLAKLKPVENCLYFSESCALDNNGIARRSKIILILNLKDLSLNFGYRC